MERGISWEDRIKGAYASLRPSEQKVASFFLAHAGELESPDHWGAGQRGRREYEPSDPAWLGYQGYRAFKGALRDGRPERVPLTIWGLFLRPWDRMGNPSVEGRGHPAGGLGGRAEVCVP